MIFVQLENVLITGGTGLLGSKLTSLLLREDYSVSYLSRRKHIAGAIKAFHWNTETGELDKDALRQASHIINLAGAPIAGGRWTRKRKVELERSRVDSTRLLVNELKSAAYPVKTFISASAVGYYGDGKTHWLTEESPAGKDFLSRLCVAWEAEALKAVSLGVRTVIFRIGIVLCGAGGALPQLARSMKFGAAVYMGTGSQYHSWAHIDDACRAFLFALSNNDMNGIYNVCAPQPVTNLEMIRAIKEAKGSHALLLPAPVFALKLALGEMSEALLTGQRCSSEKLMNRGFRFEQEDLKNALAQEFKDG